MAPMRSLPRLAWLRYPALAAMLLLSFAPSVSRLLATPGSNSGWAQLCTMFTLRCRDSRFEFAFVRNIQEQYFSSE